MSAVDHVRAYINEPHLTADAKFFAAGLRKVMALHSEQRIYELCGHRHPANDPTAREASEVGFVCEDGYLYSICAECCADGGEQTERCCDDHDRGLYPCWPCPTHLAIADGLGVVHDVWERVAS